RSRRKSRPAFRRFGTAAPHLPACPARARRASGSSPRDRTPRRRRRPSPPRIRRGTSQRPRPRTARGKPMAHTDDTRPFLPVGFAVLTVSDTRTLEDDKSGRTLAERIEAAGHRLMAREIVTDDVEAIRAVVRRW